MNSQGLQRALKFVLRWEGGFVDHPADPGGRTNKGITQKVYHAWLAARGQAAKDVLGISDDEVHAIYAEMFWAKAYCDDLGDPMFVAQFDTAVNMGPKRAIQFLQAGAGCSVDGVYGPGTQKAASQCDPVTLAESFCNQRETFYRDLVQRKPEMKVFLKGWLNRLNDLRRELGLPGFESTLDCDPQDCGPMAKVPDIGEPGWDD